MIHVIRSGDRHHFETDWLSTYWHFSFDHYRDPKNMNWGPLRVFNDDVVQPGGGFPMHPHREMEIVTYVLEGRLEHRDSLGNAGQIGPGEVQRMSAGTGIRHSEYNASDTERLHLLQLWIIPSVEGLKPSWDQKQFTREQRTGRLLPVAVPAGKEANGAVHIHQDATIYVSLLPEGKSLSHPLAPDRRAYLFITEGALTLNGETLRAGDQARIYGEPKLDLAAAKVNGNSGADFLLLDLP